MRGKNIFNFLLTVLTVFAIGCNKDNDKSSDTPPCPGITVKIYGDTTIAAGDTLNLYATLVNGAVYSWTGPQGFTSDQSSVVIPEVTSLQGGKYVVTASINGVCVTAPDTFLVTVLCTPPDGVLANYNSPVLTGGALQLYAESKTDSVNYIWTGPGGFTSLLQNPLIPNVTASNEGTYIVYAYQNFCYSKLDSIVVSADTCNPAKNTFTTSQSSNTFFYSFGSSNAFPGTRSLSGINMDGSKRLQVTFPGTTQPNGVYTINAAHCPTAPGTLLANECCVEFTDTTGNYVGVSGTVNLTGQDAMHFCSVPFKLQFTTNTLFIGSGKLEY